MTAKVKIIDGQPVRVIRKTVHQLTIGDVEDPDLYVADPLLQWQNSEKGQWIMEHAVEKPMYLRQLDYNSYGYKYVVLADLYEYDAVYYSLKWE